jgi:putative flippase GtrA
VKQRTGRRELLASMARFVVVGSATTGLYALLFLGAAALLPTLLANLAAMALSTVVATEWHRAWTFHSDRTGLRMHLEAGLVTTVTYALTSSALVVLAAVRPGAGPVLQVAAIVAATAVAGTIRYVALRLWIFARRGTARQPQQKLFRRGTRELLTRYRPGSETRTRIHGGAATRQPPGPSMVNQRLSRTRTRMSAGSAVSNVTPVGSELTSRPGYSTSEVEPTTL